MERFSVPEAARLLGVSDDTVRRWIASGRLTAIRSGGGRQELSGEELARFAQGAAGPPGGSLTGPSSARNRFVGLVTAVKKDSVMAQVDLVCGVHRLVALISSEAVDELGLEPGVSAVATVKATNVIVERQVK